MESSTLGGGDLAVCVHGPEEELGWVLPSEHLVAELGGLCTASDALFKCEQLCLANLGVVRRAPLGCAANLDLSDGAEAADELRSMESRVPGVTTVVDCTPIGCGRDAAALRAIALGCRRVRVVVSTGYSSERAAPGWVRAASEEEVAKTLLRELLEGIEGVAGVRAGAITAAVSAHPTDLERKLLRAAGIASRRSLAPIFVSLPAYEDAPDDLAARVLAELEGSGASPSRVCLVLAGLALAAAARSPRLLGGPLGRGAHVCLAGLGMPDVWLPAGEAAGGIPARLPHDGEAAALVLELVASGRCSQVLVSTGVRLRLQRERFGGGGYGHCREFFAPLLRSGGVGAEALTDMTARNAARLLRWWRPPPPPGRTMVRWACAWCNTSYDGPLHEHERLPEDQSYYEKLGFRYCSTGCLAQHRQAGFKPVAAAPRP